MKNILSKVIASSMALTLVLASAVTTTSGIKTEKIPVKAPAAVHETVKPAAAEEAKAEVKEETKGLGLIEAIEQKAAEEADVKIVKAAPEIKEEKAAPVVAAVAEITEEVAAPAPVIEEAEPVKVWDVSATENDNVSMKFYADKVSVQTDVTTGEVIISGTGAMEEAVYTNFMSVNSYLTAVEALFENHYQVEVDLVYNRDINDLIEIEKTLKVINKATGEELVTTAEMREKLNPADFLEFSPTKITIKEGVTSVSEYAFVACADLKEIILPGTVKEIAPRAFQYCTGLEKVVMHEDTVIGTDAFYNCTNLTTILRVDDAYYANLANGIVAESAGTELPAEEVNALIKGA